MILLNDFKKQWLEIEKDVMAAVAHVGAGGWYVLGKGVEDFEKNLAKLWKAEHALGCANGLDAIEISLRALKLKNGDKVLTTPLSAFATTLAILRAGGTPVFVDTDENGLIDLKLAEAALKKDPGIRFFVPVHLYGQLVDLKGLELIKNNFSLSLVEDAAQAILSKQEGFAKSFVGDFVTTSFYPTKNLGALGDGGALLTSNNKLYEVARAIRDYGQSAKYEHQYLGLNSRLDELHAEILNQSMMPRIESWTTRRRKIAQKYLSEIQNSHIKMLKVKNSNDSCWHLFPVFCKNRNALMKHLSENQIQSGIHYPKLITDQEALNEVPFEVVGSLDVSRRICEQTLSLPCQPQMSDEEVQKVIQVVNGFQG